VKLKPSSKAQAFNKPPSQNPFASLSSDYFSRFSHDNRLYVPKRTAINKAGDLLTSAQPRGRGVMAGHLADFLGRCMSLKIAVHEAQPALGTKYILLSTSGGGETGVLESFTISVSKDSITVAGLDAGGLRNGVVRLVALIGLRRAPFLEQGTVVYKPRIPVRRGGKQHRIQRFLRRERRPAFRRRYI
jgi:hypothetical protein